MQKGIFSTIFIKLSPKILISYYYLLIVRQPKLVLHSVKKMVLQKEQEFKILWTWQLYWETIPLYYNMLGRRKIILIKKEKQTHKKPPMDSVIISLEN